RRASMRRTGLRIAGLLAIVLLALSASPAWSQATGQVTGTVTSTDGAPLAGASVSVNGLGALTNAQGRFTIQAVPAGSHTVTAGLIGYGQQSQSVTVTAGQTATADFQLTPFAVELEGVVAVG